MRIKDWHKFQHFKDRKPPWIKLYRDLLDDMDWHDLQPEAAKVLVMLWLIASEDDGNLPSITKLAFRLRMKEEKITNIINQLHHWIQVDIGVISECHQDDAPEREEETQEKTEKDSEILDRIWKAWNPYEMKKGNKPPALQALTKALRKSAAESILAAAVSYCEDCHRTKTKTQHVATWLNQGGYLSDDEPEDKKATYLKAKDLIAKGSTEPALQAIVKEYENA